MIFFGIIIRLNHILLEEMCSVKYLEFGIYWPQNYDDPLIPVYFNLCFDILFNCVFQVIYTDMVTPVLLNGMRGNQFYAFNNCELRRKELNIKNIRTPSVYKISNEELIQFLSTRAN